MPTRPRSWRIALLALLGGAVALLAHPSDARAQPQKLDGSWAMTVIATSPPGLPPLGSLLTFTRDGEVIESRRGYLPFSPFGPVLETAGHGGWERTGNGEFAVTFTFLVQAAPNNPVFVLGEPLGTDKIRLRIDVDAAGTGFAGVFVSEARDAGGNLVFSASGTVQGTRLTVEPLP